MTVDVHMLNIAAYHGAFSVHEDACVWTNVAVDIQGYSGNFCIFQLCFLGTEYTGLWLLCQDAPMHSRLLVWCGHTAKAT